jgi:hypothetical protein
MQSLETATGCHELPPPLLMLIFEYWDPVSCHFENFLASSGKKRVSSNCYFHTSLSLDGLLFSLPLQLSQEHNIEKELVFCINHVTSRYIRSWEKDVWVNFLSQNRNMFRIPPDIINPASVLVFVLCDLTSYSFPLVDLACLVFQLLRFFGVCAAVMQIFRHYWIGEKLVGYMFTAFEAYCQKTKLSNLISLDRAYAYRFLEQLFQLNHGRTGMLQCTLCVLLVDFIKEWEFLWSTFQTSFDEVSSSLSFIQEDIFNVPFFPIKGFRWQVGST